MRSRLALALAGAGDVVHDAVHSSFSAMQELWMRLKHCKLATETVSATWNLKPLP